MKIFKHKAKLKEYYSEYPYIHFSNPPTNISMLCCHISIHMNFQILRGEKTCANEDAVLCLVAQSYRTLCNPMDCSPPGSFAHGDSPGKNTGVGCHAILWGIFLTQGSNSGLPHCSQILYNLSHQGSPRISEWVAYLFSRRTSQPRNQTGISCIAEIVK